MTDGYNPDFDPTGIEGGVDTNALPWLDIPQAPGVRFKPLRASAETGMISAVVGLAAGSELAPAVHLGAADLLVLSGRMRYTQEPLAATVGPGTWGYIPANSRVEGLVVDADTELLMNLHGPVAFLDADGRGVRSILTSLDVQAAARRAGPHYHLGAADFLVLSGRIGYRAGPPEGYERGVWFYEPAGARHDATRRLGDEDLVYTANIYGPIQFDSGPGTPISAVVSWMQYKAAAEANGHPLVASVFEDDSSLLAWSPLGSGAAPSTG